MPVQRYRAFPPIDLPDRTWPTRTITEAPRWLSTDLRDGNQALIDPMSPARKMQMFELLVAMGYKEIEVGFPSASETDFDFVRQLIESDRVPEDVTISVLTQAREDLIERTVQSLVGVHHANIHLYNALAPLFRRVVFHASKDEIKDIAVRGTELVMKYGENNLRQDDHRLRVQPGDLHRHRAAVLGRGVRGGLRRLAARRRPRDHPQPAGHRRDGDAQRVRRPDRVVLPPAHAARAHHDQPAPAQRPRHRRGRDRAGVMAGADRVEGCLFGHGERTGNVCLVTLGMNLFSQGIDPQIDFSDIDEIRRTVEYCTQLPVHPRHPYAGDLVYTAFSGSHQDAIKKGLEDLERGRGRAGRARRARSRGRRRTCRSTPRTSAAPTRP